MHVVKLTFTQDIHSEVVVSVPAGLCHDANKMCGAIKDQLRKERPNKNHRKPYR